jgi:hypothetical protein
MLADTPHYCAGNRNNLNSKSAYLNVATGTMMKSIRARLAAHNLVRGKQDTQIWWGNLMEKDHFRDLGADGWIILKWILKQHGWMA